jgi:hypothetical protein
MCTLSITYDQNNALARRKLAELLKTGLFKAAVIEPVDAAADGDIAEYRKEIEDFIFATKTMAAKAFADKI